MPLSSNLIKNTKKMQLIFHTDSHSICQNWGRKEAKRIFKR